MKNWTVNTHKFPRKCSLYQKEFGNYRRLIQFSTWREMASEGGERKSVKVLTLPEERQRRIIGSYVAATRSRAGEVLAVSLGTRSTIELTFGARKILNRRKFGSLFACFRRRSRVGGFWRDGDLSEQFVA